MPPVAERVTVTELPFVMLVEEMVEVLERAVVPEAETTILEVAVMLYEESTALTAAIYVPAFVGVHVQVLDVDAALRVVPLLRRKVYLTVPFALAALAVRVTA